jgi:hypothetical protein
VASLLFAGLLCRVDWWKSIDVSEVLAASFIRVYRTILRKNPEDSHLPVNTHWLNVFLHYKDVL